jgi:hypothetical protein
MATPTITSVTPRKGAGGATVTITGTNFGASGGSVKIGGETSTPGTWSATSIVVTLPATPALLGICDVQVLTTADGNVTQPGGIYVYDATEKKSNDEKDTGDLSEVFVDGLQVGYCVGPVGIGQEMRILDSIPNDMGGVPVLTKILGKSGSLSLTFRQINLANWALALAGTPTGTGDTGEIALSGGVGTVVDRSVMVLDKGGRGYYLYRCQVVNPSGISMEPENWLDMPLSMRVLPMATAGRELGRIVLP